MEPSGLSEEQTGCVKKAVFQALDALGVENGASHTEFMMDEEGRVKIIETGARMGGDCIGSDLVFLSTGLDLSGWLLIQPAEGSRICSRFQRKRRPAYVLSFPEKTWSFWKN